MAKVNIYKFNTQPVSVVTPEAETLFMCLADVNEYTGVYGGKLVFTEEALNQVVKYRQGKGKEERKVFKDILNDLIDEALAEYKADGKKAVKAPKISPNTDKDGNDSGKFELSCKNQEQPRIIDGSTRAVINGFDTLLSNGSTMKAQLYLKPYVMQGKLGVTAYLNSALLLNVIEYGSGGDMFDDDDFQCEASPFDDDDSDSSVDDSDDY